MQKKPSKPPSETSEQKIQWIPFELEALKEPASQARPPAGHMSDRYEVCLMQTSSLASGIRGCYEVRVGKLQRSADLPRGAFAEF